MNLASTSESASASERLDLIESALVAAVDYGDGCPARLKEAIQYALLAPGKRLRPRLVLMGAEACGGAIESAMPAAVAVEMVHCYSLVHDDLPAMDDDQLRRGRPTCHREYDEATAILVGDALLARAFEVLAEGVRPAERAVQCCCELGKAAGAEALVGGQADDLAAEFQDVGLEQLQWIHQRKTGALFRASPRLGAIAVGAAPGQAALLDQYGQALGLAFQIVDDLLDVTGEERRLGKQTGQDHKRGKVTYPGLLGIESSQRRVAELIDKAQQALEPFGAAGVALGEVAEYVRRRTE